MKNDDLTYQSSLSEIYRQLTKTSSEHGGLIIVDKAIIDILLESLNIDQIETVLTQINEDQAPPVFSRRFGVWVKEARKKLGLSQEALADKAKLYQCDISYIEKLSDRDAGFERREKVRSALLSEITKSRVDVQLLGQ